MVLVVLKGAAACWGYAHPEFPYAGAAGEAGTTAIRHDAPEVRIWADEVEYLRPGEDVAAEWQAQEKALGPASAGGSEVLVLGRGGEVILRFSQGLRDGPGADLVVYENAFSDTFLELAYVEVSSDGETFVRFPGYAQTAGPVPGFGEVRPEFIHGLAGKYRAGFGVPFDFDTLREAYSAVRDNGESGFSEAYGRHLSEAFPKLDLGAVRYVRILDIPGDGEAKDCQGFPVYDPYPTFITAGFDLDAVGGMYPRGPDPLTFAEWAAGLKIMPEGSLDQDGDGWPSLLEYFFDTDPLAREDAPRMVVQPALEGNGLEASVQPVPVRFGGLSVEHGRDGMHWTRVAFETAYEVSPQDDSRAILRFFGNGSASRFLRLVSAGP